MREIDVEITVTARASFKVRAKVPPHQGDQEMTEMTNGAVKP